MSVSLSNTTEKESSLRYPPPYEPTVPEPPAPPKEPVQLAWATVEIEDSIAIIHINNSNILFPIARKVNTSYVLFVFFYLKCVERKGFSPFLSYDV